MPVNAVKGGGLAGLLAAILFLISTVIDQLAPVQTVYDSPNEYVYQTLSMVAFLGAVGAVIGFWAVQSRPGRFRRLGTVAAGLTGAGYTVVALVNAVSIAQGERSLVTVRIAAALTLLIGSVILGFIVLRTRLLPWWCGVLLIIAFPLGDVANELFRGAEGVLLALLWGSVGLALLARTHSSAEPLSAPATRLS